MKESARNTVIIIVSTMLTIFVMSATYVQFTVSQKSIEMSTISGAKTRDNTKTSLISLPVFSLNELTHYDGSQTDLPIYIGVDGYVYDVSSGKEFYAPGMPYHDLAGKDSTRALGLYGLIIKQKYPLVGRIIVSQ